MQNNKHKMDKLYGLENFELYKIGREFRKKIYKVIKNLLLTNHPRVKYPPAGGFLGAGTHQLLLKEVKQWIFNFQDLADREL